MTRVKYFYMWGYFHPVSSGADVVAANHIQYFRDRGWAVDCLLARDGRKDGAAAAFRGHYDWFDGVTVCDLPPYAWSFRDLLYLMDVVADQPAVRAFLERPADVFVTNYVFSAPLVKHLPAGCRRVLETVDVMAEQFALAEQPPAGRPKDPIWAARHDAMLRTELDLYRLFDAAAMINPEEEAFVRANGVDHAYYVPQVCVPHPAPAAAYHDYDLLFVASANPINTAGIAWFYRHVYVPYLWRHGVRLAIAGDVSATVGFADAGVSRLGRIAGPLSPLYAASKLVVVPIFQGTGLSVKTLEALSHGKAVVSTPVGVRGLDGRAGAYTTVDMAANPRLTADTILALLADPDRRRSQERAAVEYVHRAFSREAYAAAMDRVMAAAGLPAEWPATSADLAGVPSGAAA